MNKKATFDDLIRRKEQKEHDQYKIKNIYVTSMDKELTFKKPSDDTVCDVLDTMEDMKCMSKVIEGYKKLIYLCCDMLQDSKLHEALGVQDPFDTVNKLFNLADITEIGEQLLELIDFNKKVDKVKNS